MKILLVSFYYYPELGAAPSRITNMAEGFMAEGAEVDVLTCLPNYPKGRIFDGYRGRLYKKEKTGKGTIFRYWTYATVSKNPIARAWGMISFALMMWLFAFKIRTIRSYDRVVIQSPPLFVSCSGIMLFKCLYRKKTILNISDLWPLSAVELGAMKEGSKMHRIFAAIERFIYRKADGIFCQSNEIIRHIDGYDSPDAKCLYRNLQRYKITIDYREKHTPMRIVYAGLLGVAQDILGIIKNVDFKGLGIEFHLYGGGNQAKEIEEYISQHDCNVEYHGYVEKSRMAEELSKYDASIVPLAVRIKGAVPSKIFDILPIGLPVVFCGGGEGAEIVKDYGVGYVSTPGDYKALTENVKKLQSLADEEYRELTARCIHAAKTDFDFASQMSKAYDFLKRI